MQMINYTFTNDMGLASEETLLLRSNTIKPLFGPTIRDTSTDASRLVGTWCG